jgi:hypothetical protein
LITIAVASLALALGIIIGCFAINKEKSSGPWKYEKLTRQANQENYKTYINSVQAANIEANLKYIGFLFHFDNR